MPYAKLNVAEPDSSSSVQLTGQETTDEARVEILRESIRAKSMLTLTSLIGIAVGSGASAVFLSKTVPLLNILIWCVPVMLSVSWRYLMAREVIQHIDVWRESELEVMDRRLYLSSLLSQTVIGTGIWSVALPGGTAVEVFVTAIIAFYGLGAMIILSSDFRTYSHTALPLLGQAVLFWLLKGVDGLPIAAAIASLLIVSLRMIYFTSQTFKDSIMIRFEKNQLLLQLKDSEQQIRDALNSARAANKMKDFFMAAAGHDLRQPLFAIGLLNETLMMQKQDQKSMDLLRKQQTSIESLGHLYDSLLDLSQFEQGQIRPYLVVFNIKDLCLTFVEEFELACEEKGLVLEHHHMDQNVFTDFDLIARVFRNLFANAVKYTSAGKVCISGKPTHEGFEVTLTDTGVGIPHDKQQAIFGEFVQLSKGERAADTGVGMGLAIVKQITSLLEIDLKLTSVPDEGTTIKFTLPVEAPVLSARNPAVLAKTD